MSNKVRIYPVDDEERSLKAFASVSINGTFAINSIRLYAGENGLFIQMPQEKLRYSGEYSDIIFPITAEARKQLNDDVINTYLAVLQFNSMTDDEKMNFISEYEIGSAVGRQPTDTEKAVYEMILNEDIPDDNGEMCSYTNVQLRLFEGKESLRAIGQFTLNDTYVVKNVRVMESSEKNLYVSMPCRQDRYGEYHDYAYPVTAEERKNLERAVISKYRILADAITKGMPISKVGGDKNNRRIFSNLNNLFVEKIIAELEKRNIEYGARIEDTTSIAVRIDDIPIFKSIFSSLKENKGDD